MIMFMFYVMLRLIYFNLKFIQAHLEDEISFYWSKGWLLKKVMTNA